MQGRLGAQLNLCVTRMHRQDGGAFFGDDIHKAGHSRCQPWDELLFSEGIGMLISIVVQSVALR